MSPDPHRIELAFEYETIERAETVERSVAREVGEIDDDRSRTSLGREGSVLQIEIEARDPVAMRAAFNTWCSLVDVAEQVVDVADAGPKGRKEA